MGERLWDAAFVAAALRMAAPLTLAALGGLFSERAGVVNIALEGMMLFGAFAAAVAVLLTGSFCVGLGAAVVVGAAVAGLHALVCVRWAGDQIVSGVAINILGLGVPALVAGAVFETPSSTPPLPAPLAPWRIPGLADLPGLGPALGSHSPLVYLAFALVPVAHYLLFHTVFGLRLRAVGENPEAAESLGIHVARYRVLGVLISGVLAGLAGAFLSVGHGSQFIRNMTAGRGYIALTAVIFGKWRPGPTLLACLLFGGADALQMRLQGVLDVPVQVVQVLPYALTMLLLTGAVGRAVAPAASGRPYVREGHGGGLGG